MITLAQQNGGPNVLESFNQTVLALRKLLAELKASDYTSAKPRFSLILRVDGSLTKFGPAGVEPPKLRKDYIQVDIVVPESRWNSTVEAQRLYLAEVVGQALRAITDTLERKKWLLNRQKLASDYEAVRQKFLETAVLLN